MLPDYHSHMMTGLRVDTHLFSALVATTLPALEAHFVALEVPTEILASQWWLCMFANVLPTSTLLRVWDAVLCGGGFDCLVAAALTILRRLVERLKATEDIAGVYAAARPPRRVTAAWPPQARRPRSPLPCCPADRPATLPPPPTHPHPPTQARHPRSPLP